MVKKKVQELWNKFTGKATQVSPGNTSIHLINEGMQALVSTALSTPQTTVSLIAVGDKMAAANPKAQGIYKQAKIAINTDDLIKRDEELAKLSPKLRPIVRKLAEAVDTFKAVSTEVRYWRSTLAAGFLLNLGDLFQGIAKLIGDRRLRLDAMDLSETAEAKFNSSRRKRDGFHNAAKENKTKWKSHVEEQRQRKDQNGGIEKK